VRIQATYNGLIAGLFLTKTSQKQSVTKPEKREALLKRAERLLQQIEII